MYAVQVRLHDFYPQLVLVFAVELSVLPKPIPHRWHHMEPAHEIFASKCFLLRYICYISIHCCYTYICYICICGSNSHQRTGHSGPKVFFANLLPCTLWDWIEMF